MPATLTKAQESYPLEVAVKVPCQSAQAHNPPLPYEVIHALIPHIFAVQVALKQGQQLCRQLLSVRIHQGNACSQTLGFQVLGFRGWGWGFRVKPRPSTRALPAARLWSLRMILFFTLLVWASVLQLQGLEVHCIQASMTLLTIMPGPDSMQSQKDAQLDHCHGRAACGQTPIGLPSGSAYCQNQAWLPG